MGRALIIIILGFSITFGTVRHNLEQRQEQGSVYSAEMYENQLVRNVAASGANVAISCLSRNFEWRTGFNNVNFSNSTYNVTVDDQDSDASLEKYQVKITSIANCSSVSDTVIVVLSQPPFSIYASFSDEWPSNLYCITGDTINGPMHTNGRFNFSGQPVFEGKVTSVASDYGTLGTTDPQFWGGVDLGVARIDLPLTMDDLKAAASVGGDLYNDYVVLEFFNDGSYIFQTYYYSWFGWRLKTSGTKYISDYNGVIATSGDYDIYVKGQVNGQVTIASSGNIYILDDFTYATDPRTDPNSTDLIGLVADEDIIIRDNEENRNDCEIHATMMALDRSFTAQNYSSGEPRGTLTVLGGIIQDYVGAVGTFGVGWDGTPVLKTGYTKNYVYDSRLAKLAPPFFPVLQQPQVFSWWQR